MEAIVFKASLFREPEPGPDHWLLRFWNLILKKDFFQSF